MRPVPKMLLVLAHQILGAALFFVILDDEDAGARTPAPVQASATVRR